MSNQHSFIARKSECGRTQSLCDHISNVADISSSYSHYPNTSRLISYLHDLGKLSEAFQRYITNGGERGSVIHAWQGVFLANELFTDEDLGGALLREILGLCITAHHNHIDDGISPDGNQGYFVKEIDVKDDKYHMKEIKQKITDEQKRELQAIFQLSKREVLDLLASVKSVYSNSGSACFALGLFVKYLYSVLVDADRLDAYLFSIGERYITGRVDWGELITIFEKNIAEFKNDTLISDIRKSVSEKCKKAAQKPIGIYQLSVPTGGGKTLSSLRFALHHAKEHGMKRIIYVIPYLSIIDQTAGNIRDILNLSQENDIVFEHHSNIVEPEDEKSSEIRKLSANRWDSLIIITTMVQFLESVMSSKGGKLRKFAAMADSIIIFDEIQTLPIKALHCFNEAVTFLSRILKSTILLCSATQPTLESTQRKNLLLASPPELIECAKEFSGLKRVMVLPEIDKNHKEAADFILCKANENGNCLAIVNTKRSAFDIYSALKNDAQGYRIVHLSTSMCPAHRIEVYDEVKKCLKNEEKIICVSTQLIEAGVDISFACVVRAMAGLDSIAQAAGRCNRNGESNEPKMVYTFQIQDENLDKLNDIRTGKETTANIIASNTNNEDLLSERCMNRFYQQYFSNVDGQMDYPIEGNSSIYTMLSENKYGKGNYQNRTGEKFTHYIPTAFYTADQNFSVIANNTRSVVVSFGDAESMIAEYKQQPQGIVTKEKLRIIKKLQKFSVSLYEWQFNVLTEQHALSTLDEETGITILGSNHYSKEIGVTMQSNPEQFFIQ